jgi:hypothetical protein
MSIIFCVILSIISFYFGAISSISLIKYSSFVEMNDGKGDFYIILYFGPFQYKMRLKEIIDE